MPARVEGVFDSLRDPAYATGVGLVLYAARHMEDDNRRSLSESDSKLFAKITKKMKGWFKEFF